MPRKTIKKLMPHPTRITGHPILSKLGPWLHDPGLWHVNRRSVSGAVAIGLFCSFMPIPFQMVIAALIAVAFRVNILIAVPTVWISNPFTMPPIFYFCYQVGLWILGAQPTQFHFELSFTWLANELGQIWQPFLLGCFVMASISALIAFWLVRLMWFYHITQRLKLRKFRRKKKDSPT